MLGLPNEVLLSIIHLVKQDNHLDLSSLASTCRHFQALVADISVWAGAVKIDENPYSPYSYATLSTALASTSQIRTSQIAMALSDAHGPRFLSLLLDKQAHQTLKSVLLYAPSAQHNHILQIFATKPAAWQECGLRDPERPFYMLDQPEKINWLKGLPHLHSLDLPSCPAHWLFGSSFPRVHTLTIALVDSKANSDQDPSERQQAFWADFRKSFPSLSQLTLYIGDPKAFSLFISLFSNPRIFPWLESVSVVGLEDPKQYIEHQTLVDSLMSLDGLARINAGWDLVALHK
ncbi:hypothetical protein CLU79DRAFT_766216 [Phycomyces nitens]|nr:hypothetical protein CLU79DRAFT_766216 [Phycomyces nitens]